MNHGIQSVEMDYSRKWHVLIAVGSGVFLATIDSSIINVSLPTLVKAFGTDFTTVQWVVLGYLLTVTTTMLGFGRLGDIIGKKKIYLLGYTVFLTGSALCGFSGTVYGLIAFRILQAVGAAMIMALGAAILTEAFPPRERGKAMGMIGAIVSVGIAIGPALGGIIIGGLSWRWIFYVNLPVGIVGSVMVGRNIPGIKPGERQSFDFWGSLTLFIGLLAFLLALTLGQLHGFLAPEVWGLFGISTAFLLVFLILENRLAEPIIDLNLFRNSLFSMSLATGFICFAALAGVLILIPFYLEDILHYDTVHVGLLMGIIPVMMGLSAPLSGWWSDRAGSRPITVIGLCMLVAGYLSAATLNEHTSAMGYIVRMLTMGLGMGFFISPNNSAIMGTAPRHQLGVVSGFMSITRTLGQTVGIAVLGAVWAGRTAYHMTTGGSYDLDDSARLIHAQMMALHDTFWVGVSLIVFALILGGWALLHSIRRSR
jgi:EmrB/QacA subfamily drug resistance transporter